MSGQSDVQPHVLDDPAPVHHNLLDYGERPYWSQGSQCMAFVYRDYCDVHEIDSIMHESMYAGSLKQSCGDDAHITNMRKIG